MADHSVEESISDENLAESSAFSCISVVSKCKNGSYDLKKNEKESDACTWNAVYEEADDLVCLNKKAYGSSCVSITSKARKICRGTRGREKLAFSSGWPLQNDEFFYPFSAQDDINTEDHSSTTKIDAEIQNPEYKTVRSSISELLDVLHHEGAGDPVKLGFREPGAIVSVSEQLEDLQEKKGSTSIPFNMILRSNNAKVRKGHSNWKRSLCSLGSRSLHDEDPPDFVSDLPSSEDEVNYENDASHLRSKQTMSELLLEVFDTDVLDRHTSCTNKIRGNGYHSRLQQVLQLEKDQSALFLKQIRLGIDCHNETSCMKVRVLSRLLESKLTVCRCQQDVDGDVGEVKTVIFNSKICDNVDLDIGNIIHIYSPWKEVNISAAEKIILSSFFAQAKL